jgi:hypothetical protein
VSHVAARRGSPRRSPARGVFGAAFARVDLHPMLRHVTPLALTCAWVSACGAPQSSTSPPRPDSEVAIAHPRPPAPAHAARPAPAPLCPPPKSPDSGPPWERAFDDALCIRTARGRALVDATPRDADGYDQTLRLDLATGESARVPVTAPVALAARPDGHILLLDLKHGVSLVSWAGEVSWRKTFPKCGAVRQLAIASDDTAVFSCGYSVLRLAADGALLWQVWPFGDESVRGPWVTHDGTIFVAGGGNVAALDGEGKARWTTSLGSNRATSDLAWSAAGQLVVDTSMAARHSDPTRTGGMRIYYQHEPPELIELSRDGKVLTRSARSSAVPEGGWPPVLPRPEDGSHRVR